MIKIEKPPKQLHLHSLIPMLAPDKQACLLDTNRLCVWHMCHDFTSMLSFHGHLYVKPVSKMLGNVLRRYRWDLEAVVDL